MKQSKLFKENCYTIFKISLQILFTSMHPPSRKRQAPERLDPHPPGSKHELGSQRVKKIAVKKQETKRKRKQRDKKKVCAKTAVEEEGGDKKEQVNNAGVKRNAGVSSKTPNKSKKSKK